MKINTLQFIKNNKLTLLNHNATLCDKIEKPISELQQFQLTFKQPLTQRKALCSAAHFP